MAVYYSLELSEKVTRGMTDNALKCQFNGGTIPTVEELEAMENSSDVSALSSP